MMMLLFGWTVYNVYRILTTAETKAGYPVTQKWVKIVGFILFAFAFYSVILQLGYGVFPLEDNLDAGLFWVTVILFFIVGANIIRNQNRDSLKKILSRIVFGFAIGIFMLFFFRSMGWLSLFDTFTTVMANVKVLFGLLAWLPPVLLLFDIALTATAADDFDQADGLWIDLTGSIVYTICAYLFQLVGYSPQFSVMLTVMFRPEMILHTVMMIVNLSTALVLGLYIKSKRDISKCLEIAVRT
jgi:hypothetical protein